MIRKLRHRIVLYFFNRYFGNLVYGFQTAEERFAAMNETQKTYYYEEVTSWINSDAYELENKGLIEKYYTELATKAVGEDVLTAYRLALLLIKNQDIRLRQKAREYKDKMAIQKTHSNFK